MASPTANYGFSFNGWLFGGAGQGVQVLSIQGLEDLPGLRTQDDIRGYSDGMFTGRDFLNGRSVVIQLEIMNDASNTMFTYLNQLKSYLISQQSGTSVLQFIIPNRGTQRLNARVRKRHITIDPTYTYGKAIATVEFFCPDPRIYNDTQTSTVFTPAAGTGRTYPRVYPLLYNASTGSPGNQQALTNNGNTTTYPVATIVGPVVNPSFYSTTGGTLTVNATLTASDTVTIDTDMKSILFNGSTARNLLANGSTWFALDPGTTTLGLTCSSYTAGATMTVTYRDAYL